MSMNKIATTQLDITAHYQDIKKLNVEFYNQDIGNSKLVFQIKRNNQPMLLSEINVDSQIILVTSDGSKKVDNLTFENEMKGIVSYTLPTDVLAHVGEVTGEIFINRKGSDDTVVVRTFKFSIKDALINTISGDTKLSYIRKFDDLESLIKQRVLSIQESIKNLEDYVTKVNDAKEDALQAIGVDKDNVQLIIENGKNEIEALLDNDTFLKVEDFKDYKKNIDDQFISFKDDLESKTSDKVKQSEFDALNLQKYKLTNDDATIKIVNLESNIDYLNEMKETGFFYTTNTPDLPSDVSSAGFLTVYARTGKSPVKHVFQPYSQNKIVVRHYYNGWSEWEKVSQAHSDTGWIHFNLLNGANSNTEYKDKNGYSCSYRTITNGGVPKYYLRLNGNNVTDGQTIAKIPSSMVKYAQTFPVRTPTNKPIAFVTIHTDGSVVLFINKSTSANDWGSSDYIYTELSWVD